MAEWSNFFMAVAGTSGALIGLLFVGLSINLKTILRFQSLPYRALEAIYLLFAALLVSLLVLVPGQGRVLLGAETLLLGLLAWGFTSYFTWASYRKRTTAVEKKHAWTHLFMLFFDQIATLSYLVGGSLLLTDNPFGFYWFVPAMLLSLVIAVMDSWVLLVEINR
jgi:hypothetical protein